VPQPEDKQKLFLVFDDQFNVRRIIFSFLRTFGYNRVVDASYGEKALEILVQGRVGFIICDWNTPRMSGLALFKHGCAPRVVGLICHFSWSPPRFMEDIVAEAIEESVDGYIVKPFQGKTLTEKSKNIIDRRRNLDPQDPALRQRRGLTTAGKPLEAEARFEAALSISPASPRVLLAVGEFKEVT